MVSLSVPHPESNQNLRTGKKKKKAKCTYSALKKKKSHEVVAASAKAIAGPSSGQEVRAMMSIAVLCSHLNGGQKPCEISEQREGERSVEMKQWFTQQ